MMTRRMKRVKKTFQAPIATGVWTLWRVMRICPLIEIRASLLIKT